MSGVPLSAAAWEILRALVLGIRIREFADGWRAVGPWQEPTSSGIASAVMDELLHAGFIQRETLGVGHYASITKAGESVLSDKTTSDIRNAIKWARRENLK
jgi:hypothetical protein